MLVHGHHRERGERDDFGERCHVVDRAAIRRPRIIDGELADRVLEVTSAN